MKLSDIPEERRTKDKCDRRDMAIFGAWPHGWNAARHRTTRACGTRTAWGNDKETRLDYLISGGEWNFGSYDVRGCPPEFSDQRMVTACLNRPDRPPTAGRAKEVGAGVGGARIVDEQRTQAPASPQQGAHRQGAPPRPLLCRIRCHDRRSAQPGRRRGDRSDPDGATDPTLELYRAEAMAKAERLDSGWGPVGRPARGKTRLGRVGCPASPAWMRPQANGIRTRWWIAFGGTSGCPKNGPKRNLYSFQNQAPPKSSSTAQSPRRRACRAPPLARCSGRMLPRWRRVG